MHVNESAAASTKVVGAAAIISRALYRVLTMYLAVTSNGRSEKISNMLQKYFAVDEAW